MMAKKKPGGKSIATRFQPGNRGGPGNPMASRIYHRRQLLQDAVSDEDFTAIVDKIVKDAKGGDLSAAKFLIERVAGSEKGNDGLFSADEVRDKMALVLNAILACISDDEEKQKVISIFRGGDRDSQG